jgi:integrase
VAGFVRWQLEQGYAVAPVNVRLSTVKQYAKLAFQAGALDATQHALIRTVTGYQYKEQTRVDEKRTADGKATRIGAKEAKAVALTAAQVKALKCQPDTAQGQRDALLMCLLLDRGLRVGEIAALDVTATNLETGEMEFYRPKVGKTQKHKLSRDTLRAAKAWFASGDALGKAGMSERAITRRVNTVGEQIGVEGLSAHDGRYS